MGFQSVGHLHYVQMSGVAEGNPQVRRWEQGWSFNL